MARSFVLALVLAGLMSPAPAYAVFHLMQIEQVIAGVDGSTATQAIQLRQRAAGQNLVSGTSLVVRDATGANPVDLIVFPSDVGNGASGARILVATAGFASATNPSVTPDFTLTNPIPDSYMAAGTLTFEDPAGTVLWRLCWGGAGYTGPTDGIVFNDLDGNCAPILVDPLPTASGQALRFQFAATALGTNNANDYDLTASPATFTNNLGGSGTIVSLVDVPDGAAGTIALGSPVPNPVRGAMSYSVTLPRAMRVEVAVYDLTGRRRLELVDEVLPAGRSSLTWDARATAGAELRAGVYFLALTAEGVRRSARFVLLGRDGPSPHGP